MQRYYSDKIHIVLYDKRTGRIWQSSFIGSIDEAPLCCTDDQDYLICGGSFLDHERYYVVNGALTLRPQNPSRLEGAMLVDVPANAVISIDEVRYKCVEGGKVTLEFGLPKTYAIRVVAWPFLDAEFDFDYSP
ncbi:hypothetical protein E4695_04195 [Alcaligenaceae bacterium 429]|nr:hypothetical protein E4695_04195 [Alcaligenaceae bacterium 429]